MNRTWLLLVGLLALGLSTQAVTQYPDWQHTGSLYIITTPEGAGLPATASEDIALDVSEVNVSKIA
ncbi:MAG: hypothetical protein CMJ64_14095 [Planctomycetaceae bacterium]|nr:hypothetical protein [Planctomycetaceae bacterium]|tara:strand:- start:63 stop:260 length:198 start_codon:yes stop_codon:yes gene_type:complete